MNQFSSHLTGFNQLTHKMSSPKKEKFFLGESLEQEPTRQGETGLCHLQGACVAEAVEPRLVGMKHEGKPFTSMQGDASCQGVPHGRLWLETVPSRGLQRTEVSSEATECPLPGKAVLSLAWLLVTVAPLGTPARLGVACLDTHFSTDLPIAYNPIQPCLEKGTTELRIIMLNQY